MRFICHSLKLMLCLVVLQHVVDVVVFHYFIIIFIVYEVVVFSLACRGIDIRLAAGVLHVVLLYMPMHTTLC